MWWGGFEWWWFTKSWEEYYTFISYAKMLCFACLDEIKIKYYYSVVKIIKLGGCFSHFNSQEKSTFYYSLRFF